MPSIAHRTGPSLSPLKRELSVDKLQQENNDYKYRHRPNYQLQGAESSADSPAPAATESSAPAVAGSPATPGSSESS